MKHTYTVLDNKTEHSVEIQVVDDHYELKLGKHTHRFEVLMETPTLYSFLIDGSHVLEADASFHQDKCELYLKNVPYHLEVFDPRRRMASLSEAGGGSGLIEAPMPGKIIEIKAKTGDEVKSGDAVIVIEAMKMQNELNAPIDGKVKEIAVNVGDAVEADQKLAVIG